MNLQEALEYLGARYLLHSANHIKKIVKIPQEIPAYLKLRGCDHKKPAENPPD